MKRKKLIHKDDDILKQVNEQNAIREKNRERVNEAIVESDTEEESDAEEEQTGPSASAISIIQQMGDNEWFKVSKDAEEVVDNLETAAENADKIVGEEKGVMNLPSVKSKDFESSSTSITPRKTEIGKVKQTFTCSNLIILELELEAHMERRRRKALLNEDADSSDEDGSADEAVKEPEKEVQEESVPVELVPATGSEKAEEERPKKRVSEKETIDTTSGPSN